MWAKDIENVKKGTLIDVRYREEFDQNCVPGSINIPWDLHLYYLDELMELPKPLVFFCEEGYRSGLVTLSLQTLGFEEVYNGGRWFDVLHEMEDGFLTAA
ncbi:MAG: rhodanese-like domain-containing protein [Mameliella sp.]|nr:rhodanese-like domain-containing protein [Phaeodactylibacter sp.]